MYTLAYDEDALALVAVHGPGGRDDEDLTLLVTALARMAEEAARRKAAARLVIFVKDGAVPPTAAERAAIKRHVDNVTVRFALVTRSGVARAMMAASKLVAERSAGEAFATFEDAAAWMARQTGQESTILRRLLAAAETAALRLAPPAQRS